MHSAFQLRHFSSLRRLKLDVSLSQPDPVAPAFQLDDHHKGMIGPVARVLQFLVVDSGIVLEPKILENGMSDYNCIDVIRETQATVAAAQSSTLLIPPLGREKAGVFTLNLPNRLIFKAADEEGAVESADFLGRQRVIKKSWGYSAGKMSRNYAEQEEHKIKPHLLRNLTKHTAVVIHCERGHRRKLLPPLQPDGTISQWFNG